MAQRPIHLQPVGAAFLATLACALVTAPAQAQTYKQKVLHSFSGGADGGYPYAPVIRVDGKFYGTTLLGGQSSCNAPNGCGTVYQMNEHGHETVLYSFTGVTNGDGAYPAGPLMRDAQGNFYGTTEGGGTDCDGSGAGCGTVFKIDTAGKETVLHAFTDSYGGQGPNSGVVRDSSGNLYGTNYSGGDENAGSIFKVDAGGNYTLLHSFTCAANDGCYPNLTPMIMDKKGDILGVTAYGGAAGGWGVIYKLETSSNKLKILYSFSGGSDGGYPMGAVLQDKAGNLYGTTLNGGVGFGNNGEGVVYKLAKGVQSVLYTVPAGGSGPYGAGLVMDAAGNLFGTTSFSGADQRGSVFKIDPSGNETDLYSFSGGADGDSPWAPVTLTSKGELYGTTVYGGAAGSGVFFKLTPK
ncbi:MAG TPA: choice-of-anchor tandem repeat GloVer-containing protein [Rhizomicrobium sp.]|jgi:uncharacterized repeat protein (TIGR03803 family)|nr:choice-of-anchor tandem repeat GloVer-containing protein [Rhizomicrobium sp.]